MPLCGSTMVQDARVTAMGSAGDANALQGDYGECWLEAVAASDGILHGRPTTLDFEKADVELVLQEEVGDTTYPAVKAQVKTTHDFRVQDDGTLVYDLDVKAYDVLRRDNHAIRRVLVVLGLSEGHDRVRVDETGALLFGRGAWVSLEGSPATANTTTIAVHLPPENTLDPDGIRRMLATYGTRRSTPVPELDPWKEDSA
jgi:hypothetical protein